VVLIVGLICSGSLLWFYSAAKKLKQSVVRINSNDQQLKLAAKAAQGTLPKFVERLRHPLPGDRFAVKGRFHTDAGPEYLWLKDPKLVPGGFVGVLDQVPIAVHAKKGDSLHVKPADVYDWLVHRADGSTAGGFTEIALQQNHG
jgi:uncharacterized protein YegJ (DUF2314 family)